MGPRYRRGRSGIYACFQLVVPQRGSLRKKHMLTIVTGRYLISAAIHLPAPAAGGVACSSGPTGNMGSGESPDEVSYRRGCPVPLTPGTGRRWIFPV